MSNMFNNKIKGMKKDNKEMDAKTKTANKLAEAANKANSELKSTVEATNSLNIPVENIKADPNQPRKFFDEEEMKRLVTSIQEQGLIQPISVVREDTNEYRIVAGERRWRAHKELGLKDIPAMVLTEADLANIALNALSENMIRADLSAIEEALAFKGLVETHNLTHEDIGKKFSLSRASVSNKIGLLGLSENIKSLISTRQISEGHAKVIKGLNAGKTVEQTIAQENLANYVVEQGLSVRALEAYIKQVKAKKIEIGEPALVETPKKVIPVEDIPVDAPLIEVSKTETIQDATAQNVPQGTVNVEEEMSDDDIIAQAGGLVQPAGEIVIPEITKTNKNMKQSGITDPLESLKKLLEEMLPLSDYEVAVLAEGNSIMISMDSAIGTDAKEILASLFKA